MAVAPDSDASPRIQEAKKVSKSDPPKAEAVYREILSQKPSTTAALQEYEAALMGLGEFYRDTGRTNELAELVKSSTSSLSSFTKAKTAKLGMAFDPRRTMKETLTDQVIASSPTPRPLPVGP